MNFDLVAKLLHLQNLSLFQRARNSLKGVKGNLDRATSLKSFSISDPNIFVDPESLISLILDSARGRVQIEIFVKRGIVRISLVPYLEHNFGEDWQCF